MSRSVSVALAVILLAAGCESAESKPEHEGDHEASPAGSGEGKVLYYRSPMDPSFIAMKPGKDAMGMDLVPVREGDPGADLNTIVLNGAMVQRMGVRIAEVKRGALESVVRAAGRIEVDETRVAKVNTKYEGWVEKLYVNETGQKVKRGQALFAIYSPELVASQREYVQVVEAELSGPHAEHLKKAARGRLRQYDVSKALINRIEKSGKAQRWTVFVSPAEGYVIHKTAWQGSYVGRGANLFTIADLDALWVLADVYEYDAPWIVKGQRATVQLDYLRGEVFETTVDYIYPTLDEQSRTLRVRLKLENLDEVTLKPGMFATVRIYTRPVENALLVPPSAVIHSGVRDVLFVAKGNGQFEPRDVRLGVRSEDAYQVLEGVAEGDKVVVSGQFLLDSESQLKEAVKKMLGSNVDSDQGADAAGGDDADGQGGAGGGAAAPSGSAHVGGSAAHPKGH